MTAPGRRPSPLFARGSWPEARPRRATSCGGRPSAGRCCWPPPWSALVWANSPLGGGYIGLRDITVGPAALHLDLTLGQWAADGLLAIFFFVAGLELKREFVAGDLRDPRRAALPVAAAVGGMVVPAVLFVLVNLDTGGGALRGWAIPTATDIAFALAVLAVISTHLPAALRTFLLTLAVVDDLLAIIIIAVFYTTRPAAAAAARGAAAAGRVRRLGAAAGPVVVAADAAGRRHLGPGARVRGARHRRRGAARLRRAGVRSQAAGGPDAGPGLAEHFEHRVRPLSAGFAVPVFAFFAAGVTIGGLSGLAAVAERPGRGRHHRRPSGRASPSASSAPPTWWPGSPGPTWTRTCRWVDVLGLSPARPASDSPSRCSSANSPSGPAATRRARQGRRF